MKILMIALMSFMLVSCKEKAQTDDDIFGRLSIVTQDGKRHDFTVETALEPKSQQQGLMNRTEMADNAGMLFVFPEEQERGFWMKNTLIPLDMIFIREDGKIHRIHDSAIPEDLTSIKSNGPVIAVLEVNGGLSKRLGISAGDTVHSPFFKNDLE